MRHLAMLFASLANFSNTEARSKLTRRKPFGFSRWVCLGLVTAIGFGCAVNPVTGRNELVLVGDRTAIATGEKSYVPAQQMQGGAYNVDPELGQYVNRVGRTLATASGVNLPYEFVVLNNGVPNAWAMPGGKIAINRGLLVEMNSESELAAVLGHEIVHAAGRHGAKSMERGMLLQTGLLVGTIFAQNQEYGGMMMGAAQVAAGFLNQKYGRNAEREADYYGTRYLAKAGYDPQASVTLQQTFVRLAGDRRQSSWLEGLFASHPPSQERVENNRGLVAELRKEGFTGGKVGGDEYQAAISTLRRDREAYAAYDAARQAYGKKDFETALTQVNKALNQQPKEALFHALRGDLRRVQGRWQDAVTNYDRALGHNDGLFAHYLGRGLAYSNLGNRASAKNDFSSSLNLLPTSIAYNELGKIAESEGQREAAERYYQAASQSGDNTGLAARSSYYRLAVPREPAKFIATRLAENEKGQMILLVQNRAQVDLNNVQLQVELLMAAGGTKRATPVVRLLPAGKTVRLPLNSGVAEVQDGRAYAVSARVAGR